MQLTNNTWALTHSFKLTIIAYLTDKVFILFDKERSDYIRAVQQLEMKHAFYESYTWEECRTILVMWKLLFHEFKYRLIEGPVKINNNFMMALEKQFKNELAKVKYKDIEYYIDPNNFAKSFYKKQAVMLPITFKEQINSVLDNYEYKLVTINNAYPDCLLTVQKLMQVIYKLKTPSEVIKAIADIHKENRCTFRAIEEAQLHI